MPENCSSRNVTGSVCTGGSTSVRVPVVPKRNLPRNFVAASFARAKRDCLYLVMFVGVCGLSVSVCESSSCASGGVDNVVAAVPVRGVLAPKGSGCVGGDGGSSGAVVGRGGSVGIVCGCGGVEGPGKKDGPACGGIVSLCPPKNPTCGSVGRMRPSC